MYVQIFFQCIINNNLSNIRTVTAPPKNVLSPESRLFEVKCVPAALLHFGTSSNIENDTYLRPEILTKLSTPSGAISEAKKSR